MTEPDLAFLAHAIERLTTEVASLRDDMRVLTAIVIRLDNTVERLERQMLDMRAEQRAVHAQIGRMNDRIRKLEDAP